jgi:hypothetical protein
MRSLDEVSARDRALRDDPSSSSTLGAPGNLDPLRVTDGRGSIVGGSGGRSPEAEVYECKTERANRIHISHAVTQDCD